MKCEFVIEPTTQACGANATWQSVESTYCYCDAHKEELLRNIPDLKFIKLDVENKQTNIQPKNEQTKQRGS